MSAINDAVIARRTEHRVKANAVGAHLVSCETCEGRIGGKRCAEYARVDAIERDAWTAYQQAQEATP